MPPRARSETLPDWNLLRELAEAQSGYFTARQAQECSVGDQLLCYHAREEGRFERVARGTYRFRAVPAPPVDRHVIAWLWSDGEGVLSHASALHLHGFLGPPAQVHLTVPTAWARRRLRVPRGLALYFRDVPPGELEYQGPMRFVDALVSLRDSLTAGLGPRVWADAARRAAGRLGPRREVLRVLGNHLHAERVADLLQRRGAP